MGARILPFPKPEGDVVELAWATHRAFVRAEIADPSLLKDEAHNKARERARQEFARLYAQWSGR